MANFTMYDREREFKWQIECKLSGGTYAYIDAEDIYSGRLTRQISSGEGIEVGSCYVSELDLTIVASALPSNVVSVKPYFRLLTSTEIVDDVVQKYYTGYNLGVFKIASTKRKEYGRIDLVCYDKMADLDTLITPAAYAELLASDWKPFYLLDWIATKVNVTYTFTQSGIEAMPNGTLYFKLAEETSNIKTYRDLLQYVCMLIGAYAIFDEDGHLNVKTFADTTSYSLPASFRFSESFGDVPIVYSGVELTVKNATSMFGNANNTVVTLSDNPFLYTLSNLNTTTDYATFIMQFLRNIYTEFQGLSYYAGEFEIPPDASLNVGRLLAVSGGGATSTINCFLQKIDVNFDGRMSLSCGNPNTYVTRTQNRTTSSITNLTNRIETLESSGGGNKIYTSTQNPDDTKGNEGDMWVKYETQDPIEILDWVTFKSFSFTSDDIVALETGTDGSYAGRWNFTLALIFTMQSSYSGQLLIAAPIGYPSPKPYGIALNAIKIPQGKVTKLGTGGYISPDDFNIDDYIGTRLRISLNNVGFDGISRESPTGVIFKDFDEPPYYEEIVRTHWDYYSYYPADPKVKFVIDGHNGVVKFHGCGIARSYGDWTSGGVGIKPYRQGSILGLAVLGDYGQASNNIVNLMPMNDKIIDYGDVVETRTAPNVIKNEHVKIENKWTERGDSDTSVEYTPAAEWYTNSFGALTVNGKTVDITGPEVSEPIIIPEYGEGTLIATYLPYGYHPDQPFNPSTPIYAPPSSKIISHTTAEWESLGVSTVSESGVLYVYTDYKQDESGKNIPGFKMGDGNAYVADLPFSSAIFDAHMNNTDIHITAAEREKWNNKVSVLMNESTNNLFFITG